MEYDIKINRFSKDRCQAGKLAGSRRGVGVQEGLFYSISESSFIIFMGVPFQYYI